jgi:hypothetical protein
MSSRGWQNQEMTVKALKLSITLSIISILLVSMAVVTPAGGPADDLVRARRRSPSQILWF